MPSCASRTVSATSARNWPNPEGRGAHPASVVERKGEDSETGLDARLGGVAGEDRHRVFPHRRHDPVTAVKIMERFVKKPIVYIASPYTKGDVAMNAHFQ